MKVKDLLNKYNGEFYIYENVYDEYGNLVDDDCIATHKTFRMANKHINRIRERKVYDFAAGHFFLNIYLEDDELEMSNNIESEDINLLKLSTHTTNALYKANINTIGELCNKTYWDIHNIRCIGEKSLKEITEAMQMYDLHFIEETTV